MSYLPCSDTRLANDDAQAISRTICRGRHQGQSLPVEQVPNYAHKMSVFLGRWSQSPWDPPSPSESSERAFVADQQMGPKGV